VISREEVDVTDNEVVERRRRDAAIRHGVILGAGGNTLSCLPAMCIVVPTPAEP